jgi:phenylacetate-CoA ligase
MIHTWSRFLPRKNINAVNRSIRQIVCHAYKNVAFYQNAFRKAGINPADIRRTCDLPAVPITSRTDLMAGGPLSYLCLGADPKKLIAKHTTGTTGTPVVVHMNFAEGAFRKISLMDAYSRRAKLSYPLTIVDVGPEGKDQSTKIFQRFGPVNVIRLFRSMPMEQQIEILLGSRPTLIIGRPSTLWQLALALKERKIRPPRPRIIFAFAEMLFRHVRLLLEEVFDCRVADYYNCEEVGNLAWECPQHSDRMHLNTATGWLEVVDPDGNPVPDGREGRLIVTNLYNHTMPFIRYAMGDRGMLLEQEKCSCGFNGPVMRLLEGRNENFIVLPDGKEITPRLMYDVINSALPHDRPGWQMINHIRTFQIIQEADDLIIVKTVPGPDYTEDIWQTVRNNIRRLHPAMQLQVICVKDLTPEPGKKFIQVQGKLNTRWKKEQKDAGCEAERKI